MHWMSVSAVSLVWMQAIAVLKEATVETSSAQLLQLLADVQMKAHHWKDAIASFNRCLATVASVAIFLCFFGAHISLGFF